MDEQVTVRRVQPADIAARGAALAAQLAEVLMDCVAGGASVSFISPLPTERALAFWHGVLEGAASGRRALLVAERAGRIVGTVQLVLDLPDNQPHRADVAKMLVHRGARRQGVAQRLMEALEQQALAEGRDVLVLDTVTGGDAERLYRRAGWQAVGSVPRYALMPDGTPCGTTFYFKHLAAARG
ncbi:GNAT family N-acetyltransferase [Aquincola sp. J276]|uniref:GNAT family N-acetyltransferase n=1 Tax=Aquincola sp. J276 TaxID=2898432 RepID=UPI002151C939|nr:GNAT family N-acetyltransferase [Aquincola sp. J276]MCR5868352.1 GNAT family N-acetyltransferase [Aquincola sp. J276]